MGPRARVRWGILLPASVLAAVALAPALGSAAVDAPACTEDLIPRSLVYPGSTLLAVERHRRSFGEHYAVFAAPAALFRHFDAAWAVSTGQWPPAPAVARETAEWEIPQVDCGQSLHVVYRMPRGSDPDLAGPQRYLLLLRRRPS